MAKDLEAVLREWSDDRALFAMELAQKGNLPGAADFLTEALRLLPEGGKWDARRAEYARRLVDVVEGLERTEGLEPEDRQHLVEASLVAPPSGDTRSFFEERGFSFPQGGRAAYEYRQGGLFVKAKESQFPGILLWLRTEGTFWDKEAVHLRGIARMARAVAYARENLMAASEDRSREALGCFVWLGKNHEDSRSTEIPERIAELRKRLGHASP